MNDVRAATRDASWTNRPGVALVYHVVRGNVHDEVAECGALLHATEGFAPRRDVTVDAASVATWARCKRPGCRAKWPV